MSSISLQTRDWDKSPKEGADDQRNGEPYLDLQPIHLSTANGTYQVPIPSPLQYATHTDMAARKAQAVHMIDPEGDLLIRVNRKGDDGDELLLVSSEILAKASKRFSRMLEIPRQHVAGPIAFTNELNMTGDDGDALLTACNILHERNDRVSDTLGLKELEGIAGLSAKYELAHSLFPRISKWLTHAYHTTEKEDAHIIQAVAKNAGISLYLTENHTCWSYDSSSIGGQGTTGVVNRPITRVARDADLYR